MAYTKKYIAISPNEVIEVRRSAYPISNKLNKYTNKGYLLSHHFEMTYSDVLGGYVISDYLNEASGTHDVVIPQKLWTIEYGWQDVKRLINNNGTSGWNGKNKIKSLYVESAELYSSHIFRGSTSLESINVKKIVGQDCFRGCTNLLTVTTRDSISNRSFYQCTKLHTANVYGNVGEQAFYGTTLLKTVNLLGIGITLGTSSFSSTGLEEIHIKGVSTINTYCFGDNPLLEYVIFEDNTITSIQNETFKNCVISGVITLPSSLTYISYQVFAQNDIEELRIPSTVATLVASNTLQGGILMGNSVEATIKTNAPSKPSGWGDYFALRSETPTYHTVEYGASW